MCNIFSLCLQTIESVLPAVCTKDYRECILPAVYSKDYRMAPRKSNSDIIQAAQLCLINFGKLKNRFRTTWMQFCAQHTSKYM